MVNSGPIVPIPNIQVFPWKYGGGNWEGTHDTLYLNDSNCVAPVLWNASYAMD